MTINFVIEIEKLLGKDEFIRTIEVLKKDIPDQIENLEKSYSFIWGGNDLKSLETDFPDKYTFLTKIGLL